MGKCVNINHPEFKELLSQTGLPEVKLAAQVSLWMNKNVTDNIPTMSELGLKPVETDGVEPTTEPPKKLSSIPFNKLLAGDYDKVSKTLVTRDTDSDNAGAVRAEMIADGVDPDSIKQTTIKTGGTRNSVRLTGYKDTPLNSTYPSKNRTGLDTTSKAKGSSSSPLRTDPTWQYRGTIDVAKEKAILDKMLPNIPVKVQQSLLRIPGGLAEGQFYRNVITLSKEGSEGTAFHEAFHAVSQAHLSPEQREKLYSDYRKRNNRTAMPKSEIEEALAEEFREYMLNKGESKVPKGVRKLYDAILDLINFFRSGKSKLFSEIRNGRFAYQPATLSSEKFYSKMEGLPADFTADAVNAMTYMFFDKSGVRSLDRDFDFTNLKTQEDYDQLQVAMSDIARIKKQLKTIDDKKEMLQLQEELELTTQIVQDLKNVDFATELFDEMWNEFLDLRDLAKLDGDNFVAGNIETVLDNFDDLKLLTKVELSKVNFDVREGDVDVNEDDAKSSLNITPSVEVSAKKNATGNTRLLVSMLQDTDVQSFHFGEYLPALADKDTSWTKLENALADTVDFTMKDGVELTAKEVMLSKIDEAAKTYPPFEELSKKLRAPENEMPEYKKNQFYSTFYMTSYNYSSSIYTQTADGVTDVKIGTADSQAHSAILKTKWVNNFESEFINDDIVVNKDTLQSQVNKFQTLYTKIIADKRKVPDGSEAHIEYLQEILKMSGIGVTKNGVKAFVQSQEGVNPTAKYRNALIAINPIFSRNIGLTENRMSLQYLIEDGEWSSANFISQQKAVTALAKADARFIKKPSQNVVLGPDNKRYYTKGKNSSLTKTTQLWKSNPAVLEKMLTMDYHKNSFWGKEMHDRIIEGEQDTFGISMVLFNKVEGTGDLGSAYSDMLKPDDIVERINRTMNGSMYANGSSFSVLNFADKSTWYNVEGMPFEQFEVRDGELGEFNGQGMIDHFYEYAKAEMDRIANNIVNPTHDISVYTNSGALKSFWFPELSYAPGSDNFADKNGLYDENGVIDYSKQPQIKEYIAEKIQSRIEKEIDTIRTQLNGNFDSVNSALLTKYNVVDKDAAIANRNLNSMLYDYVANSMIANIEFTMLYTGDPAFYKDLPKRVPATSADGLDMMLDKDENGQIKNEYTLAFIDDLEVPMEKDHYAQYQNSVADALVERKGLSKEEAKKQADQILSPYKNMNQGDGQGYISPKRFREIMIGFGKWNAAKHDEIFDAILDKQDIYDVYRLMDDLGFPAGQPVKGVHFELLEQDGMMVPTYLKYAQAVLWPGIIKNTPLERIAEKMGDTIDEVAFKSACKVGSQQITNNDKVLLTGEGDVELKPITLHNFGYRLQVDLPPKFRKKKSTLLGSQPRKNILANLSSTEEGRQIIKDLMDVEVKLSDLGAEKVDEIFGVNGERADRQKAVAMLRDQLIRDESNNNILEALLNPDEIPIDAIIQAGEKPENVFYSAINSRTVKLKSPGASLIQMSNAGFLNTFGVDDLSSIPVKSQNDIIHLKKHDELKGPRLDKDKNVIPGDIYIPYKAIESIPDIEGLIQRGQLTGAKLKEMLGDSLENLVGYRIPNQNISSNDALNVAGILPPYMGDTIVTYTEIVAKTGSDFDIDKMYVMMYNTQWNKKAGKLERISPDGDSSQALENRRTQLWADVLTRPEVFNELITPLDSDDLKYDAYKLQLIEMVRTGQLTLEDIGLESNDALLNSTDDFAFKYLSNKAPEALEFAAPSTQLDLKYRNLVGKAGVGQTANHLTHHPLAQYAELYYPSVIFPGVNKTEDGKTSFAGETNQDDNLITQVISGWINAYVDAAKDPYISFVNNNTKTANVVFMLLRAGVSPTVVNRFVSQPIVREYVEEMFKNDSRLLQKTRVKEPIKTLRVRNNELKVVNSGKVLTPLDIVVQRHTVGKLNSAYTFDETFSESGMMNQLLSPSKKVQMNYLKSFMILLEQASDLNDVVKSTKYDTDGTDKDFAGNKAMRSLYKKVMRDSSIGNLDNLYKKDGKETFVAAFKRNSSDKSTRMFRNLLISHSDACEQNMDLINSMIGAAGTSSKLNMKIVRAFKSYVYSGSELFKATPSEIEGLFRGPNSMKSVLSVVNNMFPDHKLFSHFGGMTDRDSNIDYITFPSAKDRNSREEDDIWMEWDKLLDPTSEEGDVVIGRKTKSNAQYLTMPGDDVGKIVSGDKTSNTRYSEIESGIYQLPGGTVVTIEALGQLPNLDPVQNAAELDTWAKREGFENAEDVRKNARYQYMRDYAMGSGKVYGHIVTPMNDGDTYTMRDLANDLVKYSFYGSGFQKGVNTFFNLVPHTVMAGTYSKDGGFYSEIKNLLNNDLNKSGYTGDMNFVDSFFRHEFRDDQIVPKMIIRDAVDMMDPYQTPFANFGTLPIDAIDNSVTENGFTIKFADLPENFIETRILKTVYPKQYVKIVNNSTGDIWLFKLASTNIASAEYLPITPLRETFRGNNVFGYSYGEKASPVFGESLPGDNSPLIPLSFGENNYDLGESIDIDKNSFKFESIPDVIFKTEERVVDGQTVYTVIHSQADQTKSVLAESEFAPTIEEAIGSAKSKLKEIGYTSIMNSINNKC